MLVYRKCSIDFTFHYECSETCVLYLTHKDYSIIISSSMSLLRLWCRSHNVRVQCRVCLTQYAITNASGAGS